jgi:hypothetical protein
MNDLNSYGFEPRDPSMATSKPSIALPPPFAASRRETIQLPWQAEIRKWRFSVSTHTIFWHFRRRESVTNIFPAAAVGPKLMTGVTVTSHDAATGHGKMSFF